LFSPVRQCFPTGSPSGRPSHISYSTSLPLTVFFLNYALMLVQPAHSLIFCFTGSHSSNFLVAPTSGTFHFSRLSFPRSHDVFFTTLSGYDNNVSSFPQQIPFSQVVLETGLSFFLFLSFPYSPPFFLPSLRLILLQPLHTPILYLGS